MEDKVHWDLYQVTIYYRELLGMGAATLVVCTQLTQRAIGVAGLVPDRVARDNTINTITFIDTYT